LISKKKRAAVEESRSREKRKESKFSNPNEKGETTPRIEGRPRSGE